MLEVVWIWLRIMILRSLGMAISVRPSFHRKVNSILIRILTTTMTSNDVKWKRKMNIRRQLLWGVALNNCIWLPSIDLEPVDKYCPSCPCWTKNLPKSQQFPRSNGQWQCVQHKWKMNKRCDGGVVALPWRAKGSTKDVIQRTQLEGRWTFPINWWKLPIKGSPLISVCVNCRREKLSIFTIFMRFFKIDDIFEAISVAVTSLIWRLN